MKCKTLINLIVLGILTGSMPSIVMAKVKKDSLILKRIYEFNEAHPNNPDSVRDNVYMRVHFNVERRNPTLWLIPTMYVMAKDARQYIRESYNDVTFMNGHQFQVNRQLLSGTIQHNRNAMPTLLDLTMLNVYDAALSNGHILSPFNKYNRRYYKYKQSQQTDSTTRLDFKPKLYNTQLLNGYAIVNTSNGHIIRTVLNGEYDMISFRTELKQSPEEWPLPSPSQCTTAATFKFMGNRISTLVTANFNCPPLPDSILHISSRELMDSLRPVPLPQADKQIYDIYDAEHQADTVAVDTVEQKPNILKKIFWDTIGATLVTPIESESEQLYFSISPLINPLYVSYSDSHGLSYKLQFGFQYIFSPHRYITLDPKLGYNFKIKQFYFSCPLRIVYNPKRNGYAEIIFANGNRIGNATIQNAIRELNRDTIKFVDDGLTKFNDTYLRVFNNIMTLERVDVEAGFVMHDREAVDKDVMRKFNLPTYYRTFAPMIGINFQPWKSGPLFCIDWERSFTGFMKSNIAYERWEFDAQWKHHIPGLRLLNMRAGAGFYSHKYENYFLDYENFRKTNLPSGWDDNWSGDFQLLDDDAFNESDYYVRANVSYESPLLIATWTPYLGKYIEKERFYVNAVLMQDSRPYYELGYGFTNRYLSVGAFAGFSGTHFQRIGFKFDFELFRRW